MGLVLFVFWVKVFRKAKKPYRKREIPKKTTENPNNFMENQKNKVFKGFRLTFGYGFGFVCLFGFPEGFYKTKQNL